MLKDLKENEFDAATKLIFDGLSMAKISMEQILQSPIEIKRIDYGDSGSDKKHEFYNGGNEKVHLIKTNLMGELKGTSYLILSEEEATNICKACLPPSVLEKDSPENKMMIMGFLSEIDNMVAAAVITEFSNFLGMDIFGQVPTMQLMEAPEVNPYLSGVITEFDSVIHFKAVFNGLELDIAPDFVWIFQSTFVEQIKNVLKTK